LLIKGLGEGIDHWFDGLGAFDHRRDQFHG